MTPRYSADGDLGKYRLARGVLFLDEVTEFRRDGIEALRQPLKDGRVVEGQERAVEVARR